MNKGKDVTGQSLLIEEATKEVLANLTKAYKEGGGKMDKYVPEMLELEARREICEAVESVKGMNEEHKQYEDLIVNRGGAISLPVLTRYAAKLRKQLVDISLKSDVEQLADRLQGTEVATEHDLKNFAGPLLFWAGENCRARAQDCFSKIGMSAETVEKLVKIFAHE